MKDAMKTTAFLAVASEAKLVVLENGTVTTIELDYRNEWILGRKVETNNPDIPLHSPIAGREHGKFVHVEDKWYYLDLGSINGTIYNGEKFKTSEEDKLKGNNKACILKNGDVLRIDSDNLDRPDSQGVWILFTTDQLSDKWKSYSLKGKNKWTIGRDSHNDIVIDKPYISARHAEIRYKKGQYYLYDCKSRAGTWVNGMCIRNSCPLKEKDRISICDWNGLIAGNQLIYNDLGHEKKNYNGFAISAKIKSKTVPNMNGKGKKELIRDVQVKIREGTLVALLGGSGAGKTTLMNCLNGIDTKGMEGEVLFYGENLMQHFDRLKLLIGSVPQENVFHEMLTVGDELKFSAKLQLPADTKKNEIERRVNEVLKELKLENQKKTTIRKCSGGEQKRVNIAKELVSDKRLLCLDEPDAGLDPQSKRELFTILRNLAHSSRKTILVIIHDVSDIQLFDQVIMMVKYQQVGRLSFSGPVEDAKNYYQGDLRDAYEIVSKDPEKYIARYDRNE